MVWEQSLVYLDYFVVAGFAVGFDTSAIVALGVGATCALPPKGFAMIAPTPFKTSLNVGTPPSCTFFDFTTLFTDRLFFD